MPNDRLHDSTDDDPPVAAPSPAASSSHEAYHSTVSTPSSDSSASSVASSSSSTSISSASSVTSIASSVSSLSCISDLQHFASPSYSGPPCVDYLKLFHRALHRRDGPLFLSPSLARYPYYLFTIVRSKSSDHASFGFCQSIPVGCRRAANG